MILLDTNLLARMTNSGHPQCVTARAAIARLAAQNEIVVIVPQVLFEFWAVATRKPGAPPNGQNGLGMSCGQASLWLRYFRRRFPLLSDHPDLFDTWHTLVNSHGIKGIKSYDARLAAAMQTHGVPSILTFNTSDFTAFGVQILDPVVIQSAP